MKRIIFLALAVLLIGSAAYGHQLMSDPTGTMTDSFPAVYVDVYAAAALDAGDVVVWDIGASTGDNDAWVATTTTANTGLVAGVVWPNAISAASTGTIVIYGMAECDTKSGIDDDSILCTSGTAGAGDVCAATSPVYAHSVVAGTGQVKCFVQIH